MDYNKKVKDGLQKVGDGLRRKLSGSTGGNLSPDNSGEAHSAPPPKSKDTIKPSIIRNCLNKIDALYNLTDNTPYGQWLKECAELKAQLPSLRTAGEEAQKILGIYYQSGRIRDTLNKLDTFAQQVHTSSNPETARIKGYNNYCFLLLHDVEALRKISISEVKPVQAGPEAVEALLTEECSQMELWKELPQVRKLCRELLDRIRRKDRFYTPDLQKMERITQTLEALEALAENPTREMADRLESMRNQNKVLWENIHKAEEICHRLLPVLTEEWFQRLDPEIEDNPINQMNVEQIQLLYREALTGLIE